MENWLITGLLPSVLGGLVVSLIESAVRRLRGHPIEGKRFARIAAFVTLLLVVAVTYVPPYSIKDAT